MSVRRRSKHIPSPSALRTAVAKMDGAASAWMYLDYKGAKFGLIGLNQRVVCIISLYSHECISAEKQTVRTSSTPRCSKSELSEYPEILPVSAKCRSRASPIGHCIRTHGDGLPLSVLDTERVRARTRRCSRTRTRRERAPYQSRDVCA